MPLFPPLITTGACVFQHHTVTCDLPRRRALEGGSSSTVSSDREPIPTRDTAIGAATSRFRATRVR